MLPLRLGAQGNSVYFQDIAEVAVLGEGWIRRGNQADDMVKIDCKYESSAPFSLNERTNEEA